LVYILYWNNRITPSKVALNDKIIATIGTTRTSRTNKIIFGDFSRGITGNLAHFDLWHIGMNMMTLLQVGEILEISLGTIPLFLWTCSFLGYTTICVIILYFIKEQITQRLVARGRGNNSTTTTTTRPRIKSITKFPNMVGFSGILFCWSTYMTLSLDKNQQICPIPMLTQVCFQTYELTTNGFKFNWGPIVQLVLLQFILKNVSFIGHLSGIIVGFLWYWNILPSLELSQPSILFPLIWLFGKYYLLYTTSSRNDDEMTNMNYRNDDYDCDTERGRGHVLGGQGQVQRISSSSNSSGYVLGSSKNNNNNDDHNDHHHHQQQQQGRLSSSSSFLTLRFIRNCFVLHLILNTWVYTQNQKEEEEIVPLLLLLCRVLELYYSNSIIISELLMIILLSLLVRAMTFTQVLVPNVSNNNNNNNNHPFKSIGILGRGYIALCTVTFITDSMTLGGWFATRGLWLSSSSSSSSSSWTIALFLFIIRLILWIVSISIVCHILDCNNEIQDGRRNHSSSSISDSNIVVSISDIVDDGDDGDEDDRIWFQIFGSFLINPCRTLGKVLNENRSWSSSTTAAAVGGLAMTTTATSSSSSSSTSRGGTRSSNSISERRAKILSSRGGGGGGNKSASTVTTKVVVDV
jgi:membrane associated rhomboid family serine protease